MSLWECAQKSSFLICFCSRNAPEIIRGRQHIEKAHMPHNIGSLNFKKYKFAEWQISACRKSLFATQCRRMKFQKVVRLRTQTRAVSAKHAERNEVKRSMISGNFEIFLNN